MRRAWDRGPNGDKKQVVGRDLVSLWKGIRSAGQLQPWTSDLSETFSELLCPHLPHSLQKVSTLPSGSESLSQPLLWHN